MNNEIISRLKMYVEEAEINKQEIEDEIQVAIKSRDYQGLHELNAMKMFWSGILNGYETAIMIAEDY